MKREHAQLFGAFEANNNSAAKYIIASGNIEKTVLLDMMLYLAERPRKREYSCAMVRKVVSCINTHKDTLGFGMREALLTRPIYYEYVGEERQTRDLLITEPSTSDDYEEILGNNVFGYTIDLFLTS